MIQALQFVWEEHGGRIDGRAKNSLDPSIFTEIGKIFKFLKQNFKELKFWQKKPSELCSWSEVPEERILIVQILISIIKKRSSRICSVHQFVEKRVILRKQPEFRPVIPGSHRCRKIQKCRSFFDHGGGRFWNYRRRRRRRRRTNGGLGAFRRRRRQGVGVSELSCHGLNLCSWE